LPCKTTGVGALNRYYGLFQDDEFKLRGIELRKHDTPEFINICQEAILGELSLASTAAEFRERIPKAVDILRWTAKCVLDRAVPVHGGQAVRDVRGPVRPVDREHAGASDRDPRGLQVGGGEPQQGPRRRRIQEALAGHRRGFDRGNSRGVLKSGEVTRRGTALLSALRPRRRASSRVVPNPRGSRGSGGRMRGPPRTRREPGRAADRRGKGRPPFP